MSARQRSATKPDGRSGRRRAIWIVAALVTTFLAVAIAIFLTRGFAWRDQVPITRAILSEPDHLTLVVNTCGGLPELDLLREEQKMVEVAVVSTRVYGGSGGRDCQDRVEVRLEAPLGDRRLVDASTTEGIVVDVG